MPPGQDPARQSRLEGSATAVEHEQERPRVGGQVTVRALAGHGRRDRQHAVVNGEDRAGGVLAAKPDVVPGGPSPGPFGPEVGTVLGVAVLGSVFSAAGGLGSPGQFTTGLTAALTVSAAILAASALVVLLAPETRPARQAPAASAPARVTAAS
jgi:hypothetical protein